MKRSPSFLLIAFNQGLPVDSAAFGVRQLHAVLKQAKITTWTVHIGINPKYGVEQDIAFSEHLKYLLLLLEQLDPDIIAIGLFSPHYFYAKAVAKAIKCKLHKQLIIGGPHAITSPESCLQIADMVVTGEGESVVLDLAEHLQDGKALSDISNLWLKNGQNDIIKNPIRPLIEDLDTLPFPDFSSSGHYYIGVRNPIREGSIRDYITMTTRGCPFRCTYCINHLLTRLYADKGTYLRRRGADQTIKHLIQVKQRNPNLQTILFYDEIFTLGQAWINEFCQAYKRYIDLPFYAQTHPALADEHMLSTLKDSGLEWVCMGIEMAPSIAGGIFQRPYTPQQVLSAANILNKLELKAIYDVIIDNPFDTAETHRELIDILSRLTRPYKLNTYSMLFFPNYDSTLLAIERGLISPDNVIGATSGPFLWNSFGSKHKSWIDRYWDFLYKVCSTQGIPSWLPRRLASPIFWKMSGQGYKMEWLKLRK